MMTKLVLLPWCSFADFTAPYPSRSSSWSSDAGRPQRLRRIVLRPNGDLPFYCRPVILFVLVWLMMLTALSFHVSYDTYPTVDLPISLFAVSLIALLAGYGLVRLLFPASSEQSDDGGEYVLNVTRLRRMNWLLVAIAVAIMLVNLKLDGLPPAFGFLSFSTTSYLEYGRFKQLLFPVLMSIVVNASLDSSRCWTIALMAFGLLSLLLYVTRGEILAALLQVFFVFSLTSRVNRRKLVMSAAALVLGLAFLASAVGNNRTTQSSFFAVLQIRREFWEWPMISLWVISYLSIPVSNLCWIVHNFHFQKATWSFLYPALPAFWTPVDPHDSVTGYSHVVDGVHTYLASYYMDLSYPGIVLINVVLGMACAYIMRRGMSRRFLTSSIFLGCMAYIFFVDNFIPLSTALQFAIQGSAQHYILSTEGAVDESIV
jgi:oligosaccharide repeat unit polymerase